MEKYRPTPEQQNESVEAQLEDAMKKVDILVERGYDMKKIGELIQVIDYMGAAAQGKNPARPVPDPKLEKLVKWTFGPDRRVRTDDQIFAQMVYGILPEALERSGTKTACELLHDYLDTVIKETDETKQIRPPQSARKPAAGQRPQAIPSVPPSEMDTGAKMKAGYVLFDKKAPKID